MFASNMQTDYKERPIIANSSNSNSKENKDSISLPVTSRSSKSIQLKKTQAQIQVQPINTMSIPRPLIKDTKDIIDLSQIQFINDFITEKEYAFNPVITHCSDLGKSTLIQRPNTPIRKWYILLNVVLPIIQMRRIKTHYISAKTLEYLTLQGQNNSNNSNKKELTTKANQPMKVNTLDYIQRQLKLFDLIENGFISSMNQIKTFINEEPKLINDYNYNRITPLYAACINGHRLIVELLLNDQWNNNKQSADYLLLCNEESVLDAAIRFSYVDIVRVLLNKCDWPDEYINRSKRKAKQCENKTIKELVLGYNRKKGNNKNIFKQCFCFS